MAKVLPGVWTPLRGVRADDNLYAKYMAGAYGAVPQL
jgi:hypothetical protein